MKKLLAILLAVALVASLGMVAVMAAYPSSTNEFGIAAPADGVLMMGTIIGQQEGWGENPDVGAGAAFDGYTDTFYDPAAGPGSEETHAGMMMSEAYVLTEIRILPRDGFLGRFRGAAIWAFNGDTFDPWGDAVLIWESDDEAWDWEFQIIPASAMSNNTGWTSFVYWNQEEHGDVAEVEFYGNPVAAPAAADPEPEEELGEGGGDAAELPAPAPEAAAPAPAPATADMHIVIALAVLVATAFVTIKLTRQKNRV